jgi:hypothetical protein
MLRPERGMLAVGMPSWRHVSRLCRGVGVGLRYLFATASKAFDYGPAQLQREGRLWGIRAGDGVAGTCGANHCALKRMYESEEM